MAVARLRSAAAARLQPALAGRGERRWLGTAATEAGVARLEPMVAREYYDYRRAIYVDITHKAILVDIAGTLAPTEPMAQVEEARIAQEIQKKGEKDGRDTELEKHKTMDGDAGNSRFHGDPLGSALNNPRADAEKNKELNSKDSSRTKSRRAARHYIKEEKGKVADPGAYLCRPVVGNGLSPRRRSPSPSRHPLSYDRQQRSSRRSISPRRSVSPRRHSPRSTPSVSRRRSPYSRRSPSEISIPITSAIPASRWDEHLGGMSITKRSTTLNK